MSVTQVKICNSALIEIGADVISSITQDTKSARLLNAIWEIERDDALRAHPWNFAIKRAILAPTGVAPDYEFDYQYDLPNDWLRMLTPEPDDILWIVEGAKILTNEPELEIKYIYRNEDWSSWDACFAEALAMKLASKVCYNLTGSAALVQGIDAKYTKKLAEARSMDGAEGVLKGLEADLWTRARKSNRRRFTPV